MAHGLPIVSFDCENGPRTIISDGEDGILVPSFDLNKFAEQLIRLMEDEGLRKEMGNNGRRKSQRYNMEAIASQWQSLFDDLMQNK